MVPFSLSELALSAFAKYVMSITTKFLEIHEESLPLASQSHELLSFCKNIERIINSTMPSNLACQISKVLQQHILGTYNARNIWFKVAHQVLLAVLCSDMKEFVYVWRCPDPKMVQFSTVFLDKALAKLKCLKSLTLEMYTDTKKVVLNNLCKHKKLEEFTFVGCNNIMVAICSKTTENLTKLNLRGSDVNDSVIPYILKYKHLRYLDLMGTYISEEGITEIIEQLSNIHSVKMTSEQPLKVFKSNLTSAQVVLVGKCFPNLTCLDVFIYEDVSLLPLKGLKKLVNLTVGIHRRGLLCYDFTKMLGKLLEEIGQQLLKLHIRNMRDIDTKLINEKCPSLQNFGLRDIGHLPNLTYVEFAENHPMQECPSIMHLEVSLGNNNEEYMQYLLSRFVNAEELVMDLSQNRSDHPLFFYIFSRLFDGKLKTLYLNNTKIQLFGLTLVISRSDGTFSYESIANFRPVLCDITNRKNAKILSYIG